MPTFTFRSPEGKTVTVTAPEGATQAEAWQVAQRQMELSHGGASIPPEYPTQPLGNPQEELLLQAQTVFPGATGIRGVGFGTRVQEGLLSDAFEERQKFYKEKYPGYEQRTINVRTKPYIVMRDPETNELVIPNQPGVDRGDFAAMLGAGGPAAAVGTGIALSGGGIVPLMAGSAATELGREAAQAAYGSQAEPLGDYLTRAAIYGAAEIPGALVAGAGTSAVNAATRRQTPGSLAFKENVVAAQRGVDAGLPETDWMRYQFSQNPMMRRTQRQTQQLSQPMQAFHTDQMQAIREGGLASVPREGSMPPDAAVQMGMKDAYEATRMLETLPINATRGGQYLSRQIFRGAETQKKLVNRIYETEVRPAVATENPVLDISKAKDIVADRPVPAVTEAGDVVNAAKRPQGELAAVIRDIQEFDPRQGYEAVQALRTRVGELLNVDPAKLAESNINLGEIKRLDGALKEALVSPVNNAPQYTAAITKGMAARKELGDIYKLDAVKTATRTQDTKQRNAFFNRLATSQDALEPALLNVIDRAGERNANAYRQTVMKAVAASDNPLATWNNLKKAGGDGFKWLTKHPGVEETMDTVVRAANELNASQFKEAWERATIKSGFAQEALEKSAIDGASTRKLVADLGGRGSEGHEALRTAIYERIIQKALGRNESAGVDALDPKLLASSIKEAKDKRWWSEVLTQNDKDKLEGLLAQSRLSWQGGGLGDGLVIASLARKIFSLRAHEAVTEIGASRMFARLLMNKTFNKDALSKAATRLQTTGKPAFTGDWPRAFSTTLTSLGLNYPVTESQ
ncbi:hypothetical protein TPMD04_38 [Thiohalocapsa phage LS06-2018-MD04]|nr:hypothetical protein TPMD04_38 [Thiohalocapsa phage LS06-2018-MD04]